MHRDELTDWVAEHVIGHKRGSCWGEMGGGNWWGGTDCEPGGESWFWCNACGRKVVSYGSNTACPKYKFPDFNLETLMRRLGEMGYFVFIKVDPLRKRNLFTVIVGTNRTDTDDPFRALCKLVRWQS